MSTSMKLPEFARKSCHFGKIANNLRKIGAQEEPEFSIPCEGLMLTPGELDEILGQYTHRSWFELRGDVWEPCAWWSRVQGYVAIDGAFEAEYCAIYAGNRKIEFELLEGEDGDIPAARITRIRLKPHVGGMTEMCFHLHVRPGLGESNLLLQEHQNREVRLTLGETRLANPQGQQQELPLSAADAQDDWQGDLSSSANGMAAKAEEKAEDLGDFEAAARRQVRAYSLRGPVIDGTTIQSRHRAREAD